MALVRANIAEDTKAVHDDFTYKISFQHHDQQIIYKPISLREEKKYKNIKMIYDVIIRRKKIKEVFIECSNIIRYFKVEQIFANEYFFWF